MGDLFSWKRTSGPDYTSEEIAGAFIDLVLSAIDEHGERLVVGRDELEAKPTKEAVRYGRDAMLRELERIDRMAAHETFTSERREFYAGMAKWLRMRLMGGEGCVVTAFDERWLDDGFREWMGRGDA